MAPLTALRIGGRPRSLCSRGEYVFGATAQGRAIGFTVLMAGLVAAGRRPPAPTQVEASTSTVAYSTIANDRALLDFT